MSVKAILRRQSLLFFYIILIVSAIEFAVQKVTMYRVVVKSELRMQECEKMHTIYQTSQCFRQYIQQRNNNFLWGVNFYWAFSIFVILVAIYFLFRRAVFIVRNTLFKKRRL